MQNFFSNTDQLPDDQALILSWQSGDESAFDTLYKRYVVGLIELLAQKTGSREIAKELTQDVFLAIYLKKEEMDGIENFKAYLFSIAKFKVFNYYRHELVRQAYFNSLMDPGTNPSQYPDHQLENKELLRLVQEEIERLPPKCREVFKLSREENLSYQAIAQRLGISENTVDQHIQKALRVLRTVVRDYHKYRPIIIAVLYLSVSNS